jgi:plastocyanin
MIVKHWVMVPALSLSLGIALPLNAENLPSFNLTIKDGRYSPEQVEIPAGQKIKLVIKNDGPGPEEFESSDLNREKIIKAGNTAEVFIGPLKPGTYKFIGEFHPKTAQGQIVAR